MILLARKIVGLIPESYNDFSQIHAFYNCLNEDKILAQLGINFVTNCATKILKLD